MPRSSPSGPPSRRPSRLGDKLAEQKLARARRLTPEQRLRLALDLSDAAVALRHACSKKLSKEWQALADTVC